MDLLLVFVIAMVITMALIPPLVRVAARLHILDDPASRKVHTEPTPQVGGLAMGVGSLTPLCLWLPIDRTLVAYLLAVVVLLVFGAWDDRVTLNARTKFAGQLIAALIVTLVGHVSIDTLMLAEPVTLPTWLAFSLTLLFLLGVTNAINLSDGLDGLAGGTTLLCCAALALLGESWGLRFVETLGVVLAGALVGFLRFNNHPARIFMGDAGSQFLGLSVGVMSILVTKHTATPLSTALPLLLIGLPVVDTLIVIVLRVRAGRSPFTADRMHTHHRLLALGFDHHEAVVVIYALQCVLLLLAWQLRFENDLVIVAIFLGFAVLLNGSFMLLERAGCRWRAVATPTHSPLARLRVWLVARKRLPRWALRAACVCAGLYLLAVALYANPVPIDIGWLGVLGFFALALGSRWRRSASGETWFVRGTLYVAVMVAVYLDHVTAIRAPAVQAVKWIFLPLLALAVAVSMRFSGSRRFEATPLDLLLIFSAVALPNLPGIAGAASNVGLSAAKLVVLCYAVELIVAVGSRLRIALLGATGTFYLLIAARVLS